MKQWPTFDDDEDAAIATKSGKVKASNHTVYMPNRSSKKRKLNKEVMPEDSSNNRKKKRISELEDIKKRKELFKDLKMQVQSLGASQFSGWDKRDWEKKRNRNMGMKAQKNQKIPRKILNGIRKKQKEKIERREKEAKEADLVLGKYKKKRKGGRFDMKKKKRVSRR